MVVFARGFGAYLFLFIIINIICTYKYYIYTSEGAYFDILGWKLHYNNNLVKRTRAQIC